MKRQLIRFLLWLLNTWWLNPSPCQYGYIGNIDAMSLEFLRSEEKVRPGITVATIIADAEAFAACPFYGRGLAVIEGGVPREGTVWDVHELRQALTPKEPKQ